ncbi:TIGR02611 family protein [Mycolicibacterium mengxianglii]|uniref:TIGR02611 family protein n=1 Tax=Mycolicibacterium mengxianglii TaxID=2736649 RepID=UPI0018EF223D|nr:TIGR02611 family protein [Mycolicibacterium mengxianglii]
MKEKLKEFPRKWAHWRDGFRHRPALDLAYRIFVGVIGTLVLGVGIIAIPYPGPGWAIVFLGLGILATEFEFAQRALAWVRRRYDEVMEWFGRQGRWVQALGVVLTVAFVVLSLWVLGALGWAAGLVGLDWPWLKSPVGLGS